MKADDAFVMLLMLVFIICLASDLGLERRIKKLEKERKP